MQRVDLVVIGAGPAGLSASAAAGLAGLSVCLLDEQARPGGQIYREVDRVTEHRAEILGADYTRGRELTKVVDHDNVTYVPGASAWAVDAENHVAFTQEGRAQTIAARRILLATGAMERPMPIPGWILPGVMTAGAAQILIKQSGLVPEKAVLVGSGPLLYLIAVQMVRAGAPPLALVETRGRGDFIRAFSHFPHALWGWRYLVKGAGMLRVLRRARVPHFTNATDLAIEGTECAKAVTFKSAGREHRIACTTPLLHHGVVPNTHAARSLGVPHVWDQRQHCFVPKLDNWGRSDNPSVFIAGDSAGIGGAGYAALAGELVGLAVAADLDAISVADRDRYARKLRSAEVREIAIRPFLDAAFPPCQQALFPADDVTICRCENVSAGQVRQQASIGCVGPNQTKAFGRAGMGPCQGRMCGLTVTNLLAQTHRADPDEIGFFRIRPPIKPVTLGELVAMDEQNPDTKFERDNSR